VQEKRRHERVRFQVPVICHPKDGAPLAGAIVDLSVGGAYIEAERSPAFGATVVLHVDLPGASGLKIPATVRWTKPDGFGAQFGLLGALETHALAAIVSRSRT
jgi:Tfp pilus assembly protein PilZ